MSGPTALEVPVGVQRVDIETAAQLREATLDVVKGASTLLMAAAVADYRPVRSSDEKLKRRKGHRKKLAHRQGYTALRVERIEA